MAGESFASGLASGITGSLENMQQSKLQLGMLSARMKAEAQNQLYLKQQEQQLNVVPPDELSSIMKQNTDTTNAIMTGKPVPAMDFSNIMSAPGQAFAERMAQSQLQAAGMSMRAMAYMDKPISRTVTDPITGQQTTQIIDPMRGQVVHTVDGGTSNQVSKDLSTARSTYFNFKNFADTTQNKLLQFVHATNGADGLMQAGTLSLNQLSQMNPEAKAFIDQLPYDAASLDKKTLGSIKAGGQKLIDMTQGAIFSKNDTVPVVLNKMANFKQMGTDQVRSAYDTHKIQYPSDVPELQSGAAANTQAGPQTSQTGPSASDMLSQAIQRRAQREAALNPPTQTKSNRNQ